MNRIIRRIVAVAVVPLASIAVAACTGSGMDHDSMSPTSVAAGSNFNPADVQFAQMMIVHHRQAVEMADLAGTRAADPEIKQLAAAIKAAQQPEIDTMSGWLTGWKQPTAQAGGHDMPGMSTMPGLMSETDMSALKAASGTDFDRQFARMMIAHHNGAIQMARDVQKNGTNPEVKRLAVMVEQAQTTEVGQLQKILDRGGRRGPPPPPHSDARRGAMQDDQP
jgi:uncharacterized protein (DUF305 family)